jgi:DNA-binding NarL/FixJ family response regulator
VTRVLIADPDSRTRQALALLLERKLGPVAVEEARDCAALKRLLATWEPETVLLDCYLPGLSRAEISVLVERRGKKGFILMSVDADDAAVAGALGVAFIYKGALPDEVLATLRAMIDGPQHRA